MTTTLTEQDRADIQADIAEYRQLLDYVESCPADLITNVRAWYADQEKLADAIADLEKLL